ncbi:uncharacterized protein LOC104893810 [Beta vulgaris subsp. vulgaris]|uniref:uncharacterized protein LOC104893810 n=1 Tax=Beta vulgaris subsp. vulgaris TaxID=3555 RepID=UPI00053FC529|nr:uncharacterized protein LOC104893810 [Beta vulgaris subsp. vulgaris]
MAQHATLATKVTHLERDNTFSHPPPYQPRRDDDLRLAELPAFDGDLDPEAYLEWEQRIERHFEHRNLSDGSRFSYAILKLTKYASLWYESTRTRRAREEKPPIDCWSSLKTKMRKRFVPRTYRQELFVRLTALRQATMSVELYIKEFERLHMACDIKEANEQKNARFLVGLNRSIANLLELQQYVTFDDVCILATKIERQLRENRTRTPWAATMPAPTPSATPSQPTPEVPSASPTPQTTTPTPTTSPTSSATIRSKKPQCFRCQGLGHIAKHCPNTTVTTREELVLYLAEEEHHPSTSMDEDEFWSNQPICEPEQEHPSLLIRRSLLSSNYDDSVDEQRTNLFHSNCIIKGKVCPFIIDSGSCTNVCDVYMAEALNLQMRKHPNPYKLSWLNDDSIWVRKQALVGFRVGEYMDQLWCDALPMTACSLLLGRPWQSDRHVMHNGKTNAYSVLMRDKRMILQSLPPKSRRPKEKEKDNQDKAHVCISSCHHEVLKTAQNKKEGRQQLLQLRQGSKMDLGDKVWLSLSAQKLHVNHKDGEPMDEGPFEIVDKVGYETFKVLLGNGICATFPSCDLVPCFPD